MARFTKRIADPRLRLRALLVVALSLLALSLAGPAAAPALPGGLAAPLQSLADVALPGGHAVLERASFVTPPDGSPPAAPPSATLSNRPVVGPARQWRAAQAFPAAQDRHADAAPRAPPADPA